MKRDAELHAHDTLLTRTVCWVPSELLATMFCPIIFHLYLLTCIIRKFQHKLKFKLYKLCTIFLNAFQKARRNRLHVSSASCFVLSKYFPDATYFSFKFDKVISTLMKSCHSINIRPPIFFNLIHKCLNK